MPADLKKTLQRVAYYAKGAARDLMPRAYYDARLRAFRTWVETHPLDENTVTRLHYYNKLDAGKIYDIGTQRRPVVKEGSRYYYDLAECLNYFDPSLNLAFIFLDLTSVPSVPSVVKSRPIRDQNENSVLYKYIKLRNYNFFADPYRWEDKIPKAVWRGNLNNRQWRKDLVKRHHDNPRCDVGHVKGSLDNIPAKSFLSPLQQLRYRYQISIEGNDVATNLKWVSASNSLCLMPKPRYETWFMEGRLEAGVHYVELQRDYEDLDERIDYYERHPDEARAIIANANAHARQFLDLKRERVISLLVLQKYFERTGQSEEWAPKSLAQR